MTEAQHPGLVLPNPRGLLLDAPRLRRIAEHVPPPLPPFVERELRRKVTSLLDGGLGAGEFARFVMDSVCGFGPDTGSWERGPQVGTEWGRRAVTGETVKPRHLWRGSNGAVLPLFLDDEKRLGIGRGRRAASQVVHWLRTGGERVAVLTNGRQWRLIFAALDYDAWCEWDADLWLEEGGLAPQVDALRTILSPAQWTPPAEDEPSPLVQAVLDSRKGQAELSAVLGERVREAVELLVQAHGEVLKEECVAVDPAEIYRAAVRIVMRMVVVLFAESRDLLPRDNALYHGAYGLSGLLEDLAKSAARSGQRLARSWNAWPRVLALFRLVHDGSHHPALPVPAYGGELFAPGEHASADGLSRALAVFESAAFDRELLPDRDVLRILDRLTRTRVKIRQGRAKTWMPVPVDFSDLSSEYIGILYEGLLDFELKVAPPGDPIVFLAVGNQPALPLSRLEAMGDRALGALLDKMKATSTGDEESEEESELATEEEAGGESEEGEEEEDAADEEDEDAPDDERHTTRTRAENWARRAVVSGKLARKPRGKLTPEKRLVYEEAIARRARQLVVRVILPGEWYLVRWGGTRKGSGTFYTRPGLAVPTVQRTLRPLAYAAPQRDDGQPDRDAPPAAWTPRPPEEILALKVCDPACGSGTFPVAALRFLTDALYASLHEHGRVREDGERAIVRLLEQPSGDAGEEPLARELLPCRPDDPLFEPRLKAILRRHVVERCVYGVDLDPLAVELCRLSLWIETMDRTLPFSFLDHKVKCGNALVGAWFDQFQHYPVMAWKNREGGDKNHGNGVHFEKGARTRAIKAFVKERLTPDLREFLAGRTLFSEDLAQEAAAVHDDALATLARLHDLPVQDTAERARIYRDELLNSDAYRSLKAAMDLWCACWFWPADDLEVAPLPTTLAEPHGKTRAIAERVAARKRFFHWELEFPDVFREVGSGFDSVLGNPPWDIAKPNSKEFFSNLDPLYRSYGKQEALRYQTGYFAEEEAERAWLLYGEDFRAQSNLVGHRASPFGDPTINEKSQDRFSIGRGRQSEAAHAHWRSARAGFRSFADQEHPFRHQGSADLNLYKLFLEQGCALLRPGGRLGFIVPAGLYSDHGTGGLRQLFLGRCRWEWLFGFENRDGIFGIHRSYKFNPVVIEKGGETEAIRTAFMRRKLEDWELGEALSTPYSRRQVARFSPHSRSILEIQSRRDLQILEKIYANSVLLGDRGADGWGIRHLAEFHMTNDSRLFSPRSSWEERGYLPDEYSRWLKGDWRPIGDLWAELGIRPLRPGERRCAQKPYDTLPVARADLPAGIVLARQADAWLREDEVEDVALPLYEGRMIGRYDLCQKGWLSGRGRAARWPEIPHGVKHVVPQFCMSRDEYLRARGRGNLAESTGAYRLAFMDVTSATNERTMVCSVVRDMPCGNSAPILETAARPWPLVGILNSLAYDFVARRRCSGLHLNYFVIEDSPLLRPSGILDEVGLLSLRLLGEGPLFGDAWADLLEGAERKTAWRETWAVTEHERTRLEVLIDAAVCSLMGITSDDLRHMLEGCALPQRTREERSLPPTGFWRVDKDRPPELRRTVLALIALVELEAAVCGLDGDRDAAIRAFLGEGTGDGWTLPETVRLADYGLDRDGRGREHQQVSAKLGPRFCDWQLEQPPEESWRECHVHARNLLGKDGYQQLLTGAKAGRTKEARVAKTTREERKQGGQGTLFD